MKSVGEEEEEEEAKSACDNFMSTVDHETMVTDVSNTQETYPVSSTLLPEEFFALRQSIPAKSTYTISYLLASIVYILAIVVFVYIFLLESNTSTTKSVVSSVDISLLDTTNEWTCSMSSIVTKSTTYHTQPLATTKSAVYSSYDLINVNDFQQTSEAILHELNPCTLQQIEITLNATDIYSIGGWMSYTTSYSLFDEDLVYMGITNNRVSSSSYYPYQLKVLDRSNGDMTVLWTSATTTYTTHDYCYLTYGTSFMTIPSPQPIQFNAKSLYLQNLNWIYWLPTTSDSIHVIKNQLIPCKISGLSTSSYIVAQLTKDNVYQPYSLMYSPPALTKTIKHFTFSIMKLQFINQTTIHYTTLFTYNTSNIYSIAVYYNLTNNETMVYYTTCTGVLQWSSNHNKKSKLLVNLPPSYASSSDGANNYYIINTQYDANTHLLYLTNLNYPVVIDPNSNQPIFQALNLLITPHQPCRGYGASVAMIRGNKLLFSCDATSTGSLSNVFSIDQLIYLQPNADHSQYSYAVLEAGYSSSLVGWYICNNHLLDYLPSSLALEQSNCSANGLAWRATYIGEDKFFTANEASDYFQAIATEACNASTVYSLISDDISKLPPYLCTQTLDTSAVSALSTAIANTELWITILLLVIGIVLSKLQKSSKSQSAAIQINQTNAERILNTIKPKWSLVSFCEQHLFPTQFFHLPFDPVIQHQLPVLYGFTATLGLACTAVFIAIVVSQSQQSTTESKLSSTNLSESDGDWDCTMSSYLTTTAFATVDDIDPVQAYSFINVNEDYEECMNNLMVTDPCTQGGIYNQATTKLIYPASFAYQSAYPTDVLFTGLQQSDEVYHYFAKLNITTGVVSYFECVISSVNYYSVAQGPHQVGYYPPQSNAFYQTIFNEDCQAIPITNVATNWLANSVINDQLYNLYVVSGISFYKLTPTYSTGSSQVQSFQASLICSDTSWTVGLIAVFWHVDSSLPAVYYGRNSGRTIVKYYKQATHQISFPTNIRSNFALNANGTILYVLDTYYILHCFNASSDLLPILSKSNLKPLTPLWIASLGSSSILVGYNILYHFNILTNRTIPLEYINSGTRIGWFVCGNKSMNALPLSLSDGSTNCSKNGIWWQLSYESDYYLLSNTMEGNAQEAYQAQCNSTLYTDICNDVATSPPYICSRTKYISVADVTSTALANSQTLFTLLCFTCGTFLLFYRQFNGKTSSKDLMQSIQSLIKSNVFLPNTFFHIKRFREAKASPVLLLIMWLLTILLCSSLFIVLVVNQYRNTGNEVSLELTDISDSEWTCSMASTVTTEYVVDLSTNDDMKSSDTTKGSIQNIWYLININESYDQCMENMAMADPCSTSYLADPSRWQLSTTDVIARTDLFVYSSAYSNLSNKFYFNNDQNIPYRYDLSIGMLTPNPNCPLASYILTSGLLTGEYVAINQMDEAYFIGIDGFVTFDCEALKVMNGTQALFADTTSRTHSNAYLPGIPHILTNDNKYQVYTCVNSTYSHSIECYQLTFVNKTYATTSADNMIWSSNTPVAQFATCTARNSSGIEHQYIAYSVTTVTGLYMLDKVNGHQISPTSLVVFKSVNNVQFDENCQFLYFWLSGSGIQRVNISAFFDPSTAANRFVVLPITTTTYFGLLSADRLIYSTLNNANNFLYVYTITTATASVIYTGFQYSAIEWFVCQNETLQDIPNTISNSAQGVGYCDSNGLIAQWKFNNHYYFTKEMMSNYMITTSQQYCQPNTKETVYENICKKVGNLPPYICNRQTRQSWLKILSVGIANTTFLYFMILTLFGYMLLVLKKQGYGLPVIWRLFPASSNKASQPMDTEVELNNVTKGSKDLEDISSSEGVVVVQNPLTQLA